MIPRTLLFLACSLAFISSLEAFTINVNFYNAGASGHSIAPAETAGLVPVEGAKWNQFGFGFGVSGNTLNTPLTDSTGNASAATLDLDLNESYVGNSSGSGSPTGDQSMMASYIAWDPVDGTAPEDSGEITITGLGAAFTNPGYDVYIYFDADSNDRTFTFSANGASVTSADSTTWNGTYREAALYPGNGNVAIFRGLTATDLTLIADSNTGRAAINAIQIVAGETPAFESIQIGFHQRTDSHNAMSPGVAPTAQGEVVDTAATHWNNLHNTDSVAATTFGPTALAGSNFIESGATVSGTAGYAGDNAIPWAANTKDWAMMEGWFGLKQTESITVANIPSSIASLYHVIIYGDANNNRTMNYTIDGETKTIQDNANFSGSFTEDSNYVIFSGLTGSSLTVTGNPNAGDARSAINGMRVVAGDPPVVIHSFAADDHYVSPGTSVTLSWSVDNYDSLVIEPGGIDAAALSNGGTGSTVVTVNETTTFTLSGTKGTDSSSRSIRVGVGPERPNIVLFLVDDMGPHDTSVSFTLNGAGQPVSYNFNSFYVTPGMEALAASGMRFTSAYAQTVCSPTRCGIMTGRTSARHGITDWLGATDAGSPVNWRVDGLDASDVTLPAQLSAGGYRTIHAGKAHFGRSGTFGADPRNIGFDINIAGNDWGQPKQQYIGTPGYGMPGLEKYDGSDFLTKVLAIEANKAIEDARDDGVPFFLHMAFYAVHSPFTDNPDATGDYSAAVNGNHEKFATMIEGMDIAVAEIRQKLIDLGVAENTLIVFVGDNGSDSPATTQDGLPSGTFNDWPMRGKKGSKWEGGTRVPFIASWAAANSSNPFQQATPIPANSIETDIVTTWDIPATLLDAAGLATPSGFGEDSHSLLPYFAAAPGTHRPQEIVVHYPHEHRSDFFSWIRRGDMKLIYNFQNNSHKLFDIPSDPTESNNLAAAQPEAVTSLARRLAQRLNAEWGPSGIMLPTITSTAPPGNVISIPNNPAVDIDNDGIADSAEDANANGIVDPGETDPDNDNSDGDRTTDGAEIKTGTNPLDPSSDFRGTFTPGTGGNYSITWPSAPGALYRIETSDSLNSSDWAPVEENVPAHGSADTTTYSLPAAVGLKKFYRIRLQ
jgi:arylsulfatase A-like enzyme